MNIHRIFGVVSPIFRRRRMRRFFDRIRPSGEDRILDVGGHPSTWTPYPPVAREIVLLNIYDLEIGAREAASHRLESVVGDGCRLDYPDKAFGIVFSNSVIEHVGTWENQQRFAAEARRVGDRLWIQTPARGFFIEPHYLTPFIHWFPKGIRRRLLRNFTVWGWLTRPTAERVDAILAEIRLLTMAEMRELFPDCEIHRERFLGIFTKSYTAVRDAK